MEANLNTILIARDNLAQALVDTTFNDLTVTQGLLSDVFKEKTRISAGLDVRSFIYSALTAERGGYNIPLFKHKMKNRL